MPGTSTIRLALLILVGVAALGAGCKKAIAPVGQGAVDTRGQAPLVRQADEAMEAGDEAEALRLLAAAIESNPTLAVAHMKMGDIYRERGDYDDAEESYASVARLEPRNFDAQYFHGVTLHFLNRLSEAVRAYLKALAIRPDDYKANLNLAIAYLQLGEPPQALSYAERAVELDPASGPARANLGATYADLGRHADAVRQYESAAELMELTPELLLNLAEALGKIGRFEEMENTLDAVIELEPSAPAFERLGFARFKLRQYSGAMDAFRDSIEADSGHYPAFNGLAVCLLNQYLRSDRNDNAARQEAITLLRRSLRLNNRQPRIVELLSRFSG